MTWDQKELAGYLVDVDTGERLQFQYNPSEITDEKGTDYAAIKIPGMSHPRYQYVAGEARRISLRIGLFKGPVKQQVHWLAIAALPRARRYDAQDAPHRVLLIFGDLYPSVTCIVRQVRARYFNLFDRDTLLPQQAEVDLTLEEFVDESVEWRSVRE